jgi:hypothetical protein
MNPPGATSAGRGPAAAYRSRVLAMTDSVVALAQDARLQFEADDPA